MTVLCCVCEHGVGCLNALKCIGPYPQPALTLVLAREIFSILFIYLFCQAYLFLRQTKNFEVHIYIKTVICVTAIDYCVGVLSSTSV